MEELIKNIILNSESDTGFIGDAVEVGNVVLELMEDGVEFDLDYEEVDEMIDNNDILQITKIVCEDCGGVDYFLEEVFDEDGETIPDELETIYIDSDLVDCMELEAFGETEIVVIELEFEDDECDGDCSNCEYSDDEDYEIDDDFEEEDLAEVLTDELLDSISEADEDDAQLIYDLIAEKLNEAYEIGYNEALEDAEDELQDGIDAIKSLRIEE